MPSKSWNLLLRVVFILWKRNVCWHKVWWIRLVADQHASLNSSVDCEEQQCTDLHLSQIAMINHLPVNVQLLYINSGIMTVSGDHFNTFTTVHGVQATDSCQLLGSPSRSSCPSLNLVSLSKIRIQNTASFSSIILSNSCVSVFLGLQWYLMSAQWLNSNT
jgi:hypothetical protein